MSVPTGIRWLAALGCVFLVALVEGVVLAMLGQPASSLLTVVVLHQGGAAIVIGGCGAMVAGDNS